MLLAVPNASEGRDLQKVQRLADVFARRGRLLDFHFDVAHNRSVFTTCEEPARLGDALLELARAAVAEIDMRGHDGVHPCIGALDVCPVVWLAEPEREAARAEASVVAERIASELAVPVFLYGELASAPVRRERASFRRGGLAELTRRMAAGELEPDFGPARPHPSAGATLATARPPLAAFNLELDTADPEVARAVAAGLRESGGGLPGVRAIGLGLGGGRTQVSTNVHDPVAVPLARVVEEVAGLAAERGARPIAAELVGLVPAAAMVGFPADLPLAEEFDPARHTIEGALAGLGS